MFRIWGMILSGLCLFLACGGGGGGNDLPPTPNTAPVITSQPLPQTVKLGATASFSVVATGTPAPTYQWKIGETSIPGANSSSYTTPVTTRTDHGTSFSVVLSNVAGSTTSHQALLTVQWLAILTQPQSQTLVEGQNVSFSVVADANPSPSYQWHKEGLDLTGATSSSLNLSQIQLRDGGSYGVRLSNAVGTLTSQAAILTVTPKPQAPLITVQPSGATVQEGNSVSFRVSASGSAPLAYVWRKDGKDLSGATSEEYRLSSVKASDAGSYTVWVSNVAGSILSNPALLVVTPAPIPPTITAQPQSLSIQEGSDATFSVQATGSMPLTFRWQKNQVDVPMAARMQQDTTTSLLTLKTVPLSDTGAKIRCIVSNAVGSVTSQEAVLTVTAAPRPPVIQSFTANPATLLSGESSTLTWTVSGAQTLVLDNGVGDVTGTTSLKVSPKTTTTYTLTATNAKGSVKASAMVTVQFGPQINTQPSDATVKAGEQANFLVSATGNPLPSYQWEQNPGNGWTPVRSGGAAASYSTDIVSAADNDTLFRVIVSNAVGTISSNSARLTVKWAPVFTTQPQDKTVLVGASASFSAAATGNPIPAFQWQVSTGSTWDTLTGGNSSTYNTPATVQGDNGKRFRVQASNSVGTSTSQSALLTVDSGLPVISGPPTPVWVTTGETGVFKVEATGSGSLSYQWYKNGVPIPGAMNSTYTTQVTTPGDNGALFKVSVANSKGTVQSPSASLTVTPVANPAVSWVRAAFTPPVVPEGSTEAVRLEISVTGTAAWVVLQVDNRDRLLYDDGSHGDVLAGDGIWTLLIPSEDILSKNTAARVQRPILGYGKAGGMPGRWNVIAECWSSSIGLPAIQTLAPGHQETDYVVNYQATRDQLLNFDAKTWAKTFYGSHGDSFDLLHFVLVYGKAANAGFGGVKNSIKGIGTSQFDYTADYGSAGRLMGKVTWSSPSAFDAGSPTFTHENGHAWMNFLHQTPFESSIPHWPKGNIAINVMGFSIPPTMEGGNYLWTFVPAAAGSFLVQGPDPLNRSTFNKMELYLMGLVPPSEVGDFFILKDQNKSLSVGMTLMPSDLTTITLAEIISKVGPRIPDHVSSQKEFRCATILLSEQLLDPHSLALYDWFARRGESKTVLNWALGLGNGTANPWYLATGGRSNLVMKLK